MTPTTDTHSTSSCPSERPPDLEIVVDAVRKTVLAWCGGDCLVHVLEHPAPRRMARSAWAMCEADDVMESVVRVALATAPPASISERRDTMQSLRDALGQRWLTSVPLLAGTLLGKATFVSSTDALPGVALFTDLATRLARSLPPGSAAAERSARFVSGRPALHAQLDVIDVDVGQAANDDDGEPFFGMVRRFVMLVRRPDPRSRPWGDAILAAVVDLTKSEPRPPPARPCIIVELLESVLALDLPAAAARGIDLRAELSFGLPDLSCDVELVAHILSNIVGNAMTFTPAGGRVTLAACVRRPFVQLTVSDTGSGMGDEARVRVFEPAVQVGRSRHQSRGLSLCLARVYAEAHGGMLTLTSSRGGGTSVTLSLPLDPATLA